MTGRRVPNRDGVALAVTMVALVCVSVMVATLFALGLAEQRLGRSSLSLEQAVAAAEGGAANTVMQWDSARYEAGPIGATYPVSLTALPPTGWFRGLVRQLGPGLFLVQVEGMARDSAVRHRVGLLVRVEAATPAGAASGPPPGGYGQVGVLAGGERLEQAESVKHGLNSSSRYASMSFAIIPRARPLRSRAWIHEY